MLGETKINESESENHTIAPTIKAKKSKVFDQEGRAMTCFDTV